MASIATILGCNRHHRSRLSRCRPQTPDEERRLVHRGPKIRPQLARSTQRVRPLPHENREWGSGALATRDVTPGALLVQGLVHQLRVWCLVLLTRIVSSTLQGMK